jgi:tRNA modification GTPase
MESSHLVLLVLDGSVPPPGNATQVVGTVGPSRVICVVNKRDLPTAINEVWLERELDGVQVLRVSALTGEGVDELRAVIARSVVHGSVDGTAADSLFNARQRDALRRALDEMTAAERAALDGLGYEFAAFNLRQAADALAEVTGEVTPSDVLDRIFCQFCIGK